MIALCVCVCVLVPYRYFHPGYLVCNLDAACEQLPTLHMPDVGSIDSEGEIDEAMHELEKLSFTLLPPKGCSLEEYKCSSGASRGRKSSQKRIRSGGALPEDGGVCTVKANKQRNTKGGKVAISTTSSPQLVLRGKGNTELNNTVAQLSAQF